jgi:diguanylate cyclase (GGDEF)-like protein
MPTLDTVRSIPARPPRARRAPRTGGPARALATALEGAFALLHLLASAPSTGARKAPLRLSHERDGAEGRPPEEAQLRRENDALRALAERLAETNRGLADTNRALQTANAALEARLAELSRLATTDALTGLANRRRFTEQLARETASARRYGHALSLLFLDLDHFKAVNDTHGHAVGDRVLQQVARLLAERARSTDLVARIGGEEFAVLLPSTDAAGARLVAEDLCARVRAHDFGALPRVTASIGLAQFRPEAGDDCGACLFADADRALYAAKTAGRDRVAQTPALR